MKANRLIKKIGVGLMLLQATAVVAQDSTNRKKSFDITSSFKPVLREAAKINFNAAPPPADSSKPQLSYTIPQQLLLLGYQPVPLKPIAMEVDSIVSWQYSNYIKLGVGNVHIPYIQAGFSFGDGKTSFFNVFANHFTSKGNLPFQKHSLSTVTAAGTIKTPKGLEWNGKIGFNSNDYFLYGYKPSTLVFTKEQLRQRHQAVEGKISLRNTTATEFGLLYNPNLRVTAFSITNNNNKATETNTILNLPLTKTIGKTFGINLGFTADITNYTATGKSAIQNNLYYISPSFSFKTPNFFITTGAIPSWDNKAFTLLPNIMADITTNDQRFTIQLGWIGYYEKGSYQRFASLNPWIAQPTNLLNTRVQERYAGFKGSLLNHMSYSFKVGFVQYKNMPLFVNDTTDGKTFNTVYASSLEALQLHGEIALTEGENFQATAGLTWNQFSKVVAQPKAWGLIPFEVTSSLRWQVFKDFYLKSDLFLWDGPQYRAKISNNNFDSFKGDLAFDMSAGIEFKITRQLNLWMQMNNLFNNRYERWNQYPVFGFNVLGGVTFAFNQK
ncbi:MAG: hypothetical protein RLZZ316_1930 [Bacteroidota bacterium]|jgi:hypothetical protein